MLRGIEDIKTLEMFSALAGEEEVLTRSVSAPAVNTRLRSVSSWISGRGARPIATPSVTTSTVRRRRLPVDELSRGRKGMALVVDEGSAMSYMPLTPWFDYEPWRSLVEHGLRMEADPLGKDGPPPPAREQPEPPDPGLDIGR
jgi:hypothetical protein